MSLLDQYLAYVEPLKGSQAFHRWSLLTCVSGLLERRVWLDRGRLGVLFPNLYTLLIGPPATGKSTTASIIVDLIRRISTIQKPPHFGPTKITQAALYKELKDAERILRLAGEKPHLQSPLMIYASELAINMVDFGGGTLTNELIDFYDSKGHDSFQDKRTISGGQLRLFNPSITLLGCTTPSFMQQAAQDKLIVSGLSSRIIFVVETRRVPKQREHIEIDKQLEKELIAELGRLYCIRGQLTLTPEAKQTFITLSSAADDACYMAHGDTMQHYFGRKPDHMCKVAMCLAVMAGRQQIVAEDLEWANAWLTELEPSIPNAFGLRSIAKDPDMIRHVLAMIPTAPSSITKAELLLKLIENGMFIPQNGDWQGLLKGIIDSHLIHYENHGTVEILQKIPPKA